MRGKQVIPDIKAREQTFAARLGELRRAAGLSQTELAGEDLSASYISLLESAKRQPSTEVIALLSARLGCSASVLRDGQPSERERRIALELSYARLALSHGESDSARERLEHLLAEDSVDQRSRDEATLLLSNALEVNGAFDDAIRILLPLFERSRRRTTHLPVTSVGVILCGCYMDCGDYHQAVAVGREAFDSALEQGMAGSDDYYRLAALLLGAHMEIGDLAHATAWASSLMCEVDESGSATGQAAIYWNAAMVADTMGRVDEALHLSERALARMAEASNTRDLPRLRIAMAQLLLRADPPRADEAWRTLSLAEGQLSDLGSQVDHAEWERTAAEALLLLDEPARARLLAESASRRTSVGSAEEHASSHISLGDVENACGDRAAALEYFRAAATILGDGSSTRVAARVWRNLGDRMADLEQPEEAAVCYERALTMVGLQDRTQALRATAGRLRAAQESAASSS